MARILEFKRKPSNVVPIRAWARGVIESKQSKTSFAGAEARELQSTAERAGKTEKATDEARPIS